MNVFKSTFNLLLHVLSPLVLSLSPYLKCGLLFRFFRCEHDAAYDCGEGSLQAAGGDHAGRRDTVH